MPVWASAMDGDENDLTRILRNSRPPIPQHFWPFLHSMSSEQPIKLGVKAVQLGS
jgi:hypothetical protein